MRNACCLYFIQRKKEKTVIENSQASDVKSRELLQEMPERVVQLVEQMISERSKQGQGQTKVMVDPQGKSGKNIVLNIWDFAGQAVYYTTHQVVRQCNLFSMRFRQN